MISSKSSNAHHAHSSSMRRALFAMVCAFVVIAGASLFVTRRASAANVTWNGGGTTNNWSEGGNWSSGTPPGAFDIAIFDGTSTKNATIDTSINVAGIEVNTGYTGTITQAAGVNVTISNFGSYSQADGTFNGGNGNFSIHFHFMLSGGTFTAPTGTLSVGVNFTHSGGTFNHNSGSVSWNNGSGTIDVPTTETFNNLSWDLPDGTSRSISLGDTLIVLGSLALNDGGIGGAGSIEARGVVTVAANFDGLASGTPTLLITAGDGSPRIVTLNAGAKLISINLNAANVTIVTAGSGNIDNPFAALTLQAGTIQEGSVGLRFRSYTQSGGTFTGGSGFFNISDPGGGGNFALSGGTFTGGGGDIAVQGNLNISGGTFTSTTGTLSVGSFTHSAGTFNHNSGTIAFINTGSTITISSASETFNNVAFNTTSGFSFSIPGGKTLIAAGNLAFNTGNLSGNGTIEMRGNVTVGPSFGSPISGTPTLLFSGTAPQTFTNSGGVNPQGIWTVNRTSGRLTLASDLILNNAQTLNITSGFLDQGASFNLTTGPTTTIAAAGRLQNHGTGDLTLGGNIQNDGIISLNGSGDACGDPDTILIRSTSNGTARTWTGAGSFFLADVDVKDQTANNSPTNNINVFSGTDNPGTNTNFTFLGGCFPTASSASISGKLLSESGQPLEGAAVRLAGAQNRMVVTDAHGDYHFDDVDPTGFYVVTPSRLNYSFNPSQETFSQVGESTNASFTGVANGHADNPLERTEYFVREQYVDFLNREPDEAGLNFWYNNIESCGTDQQCREVKRIDTSAAFFLSIEHQQTGYLVYRMYQAAFGDIAPDVPVPVTLSQFKLDAAEIGRGVIVNHDNWQDTLDNNKRTFAESFVQRPSFVLAYPATLTPDQFVDKLFLTAGESTDAAEHSAIVAEFGGAANTNNVAARGRALRRVAENATLTTREFNQAFVLMEYFGYLQRDPNSRPDADFSGYNFWLNKLETFNGNYNDAEMVKSFLVAGEYRERFPR